MHKFLFILLFLASPAFAADPIVYSQCKRATDPFTMTTNMSIGGVTQDVTKSFGHMDAYDALPDVTRFLGITTPIDDFTAPCNLIYRDAQGVETTVYQCSGRPDSDACAALDARMTIDGAEIMFSVFRGILHKIDARFREIDFDANADNPSGNAYDAPGYYGYHKIDNKRLSAQGAQIYRWNIATQTLTEVTPYIQWQWDFAPVPMDNRRFMFLSTRHKNKGGMLFGNNAARKSTLWYSGDIADGKNIVWENTANVNIDMHGTAIVDTDGTMELLYTELQLSGGLAFRHDNGLKGNYGTNDNYAFLWSCGAHCENRFPRLGQHAKHGIPGSSGAVLDALRFPTQMSDGTIKSSSYYRGNNNAGGILLSFDLLAKGVEGLSPFSTQATANKSDSFMPPTLTNITPFTSNNDQTSPIVSGYSRLFAGKFAYPAATQNNGLMFTYLQGGCSTVLMQEPFTALGASWSNQIQSGGGGRKSNYYAELATLTTGPIVGCDGGIYKANTIPMTEPGHATVIVDSPDWHEIMPVAAVSFEAIHGVTPQPKQRPDLLVNDPNLPRATPFYMVGGTVFDRETEPCAGDGGLFDFHACGTDMRAYTDADIAGVAVIAAEPNPNDVTNQKVTNAWSVSTKLLGHVPIESDGSFKFYAPADMPITFGLVDHDGNLLNIDQVFRAGKPGQHDTCVGCHVHSISGSAALTGKFSDTVAGQSTGGIKLGLSTTQRFAGKDGNGDLIIEPVSSKYIAVDYSDVQAVFDASCISCHGSTNPAAGLDLSVAPTGDPRLGTSTWRRLAFYNQSDSVNRPNQSKYVKAFNPTQSLLYQKAKNEGGGHATSITAAGLRTIADWIMLGTPGGQNEKDDRQHPTLTLHADVDGDNITGFTVGTADAGAGIDTASLQVCMVGAPCTNLAPAAVDGGIVQVALPSATTDWAQEVYAKVCDLAGNCREKQHTLEYLAKFEGVSPPPPATGIQNPGDQIVDEESTLQFTVSAPADIRVFIDNKPPGAIWDEVNRQFTFTPDFIQGGQSWDVTLNAPEISSSVTFNVAVNDTISPPAPTLVSTENLWLSKLYTYDITTDSYLDPPGLAGRTITAKIIVPDAADANNLYPLTIGLHAYGATEPILFGGSGRFSIGTLDPGQTWWTGSSDTLPLTQGQTVTSGTIYPYAQRRVMHLLHHTIKTYPGVDLDRIDVQGTSMGSVGGMQLAARFSRHFNMIIGNLGSSSLNRLLSGSVSDQENKFFGPISSNLLNEKGENAWDSYDINQYASNDPDFKNLFIYQRYGQNDGTVPFKGVSQRSSLTSKSFLETLQDVGIPHLIGFDQRNHGSEPAPYNGDWWFDSATYDADYGAYKSNIRKNRPIPAFSNSNSDTDNIELYDTDGTTLLTTGRLRGTLNRYFRWDGANTTEDLNSVSIPMRVHFTQNGTASTDPDLPDPDFEYFGALPITSDITIRRLTEFQLLPNEVVDWSYGTQSGSASANADGSVTIQNVAVNSEYQTLTVARSTSAPPPLSLTISAGGNTTVDEGDSFSRSVSISGGSGTGRTYSIEWETGDTLETNAIPDGATSFNISRFMPDGPKTQTVTVLVSDDANNTVTGAFDLTTNNVNPTGSVNGSGAAMTGAVYTIGFSTTDPGDDIVSGYQVNWGDGTTNTQTAHTYTMAGTYTISGSVVDEDGTHPIGTHQVVVEDPPSSHSECKITVNNVAENHMQINYIDCE